MRWAAATWDIAASPPWYRIVLDIERHSTAENYLEVQSLVAVIFHPNRYSVELSKVRRVPSRAIRIGGHVRCTLDRP